MANLFLMIFFCGNSTKNKKPIYNEKGMVSGMHILPLTNEEYFLNPQSKINEFTWNVLEEEKECLLIDGPDFVSLNIRTILPIIMVGARNKSITFKNSFKGKTIGVCTNIETGRSFIGAVHRAPDVISDMAPSPGLIVEDYLVDLRKFLSIPWEVATYKIWFVYYEQLSNGITCRLSSNDNSYGSDEEVQHLTDVTSHATRRTIQINNTLNYSRDPVVSPTELSVAIPPAVTTGRKLPLITITGNLPVVSHQKICPDERNRKLEGVYAVVPLDIVLLRTQGDREQLSLGVPCYIELQNRNDKEYATFEVHINCNELHLPEMTDGEKMFVYAFSGEFAAGPGVVE